MNSEFWIWLGLYYLVGVVLVFIGRILVKLFYKDKRSGTGYGVQVEAWF